MAFFGRHKNNVATEPRVLRLLIKRLSGRKSCKIEIRDDQSFAELDSAIRTTLNYDAWDHCSSFYDGDPWDGEALAEVYPDNSGPGQNQKMNILNLKEGNYFGYLYDFGDEIRHSIVVEEIQKIDKTKKYPCSIHTPKSASKTKNSKGRTRDS